MSSKKRCKPLPSPKSASELLDMYYLNLRSALLETAATIDRIERGRGYAKVARSPRLSRLRQTLALLAEERGGKRAQRMLELYSVE